MLSGCGSTRTVYPNECKVESSISIEKPDPQTMQKAEKPTPLPDKDNPTDGEVLNVITDNNKKWQRSNDKLTQLQAYVQKLIDKGVIK